MNHRAFSLQAGEDEDGAVALPAAAISQDIARWTTIPTRAIPPPLVLLMTALARHHLTTYTHSLRVAYLTSHLATALDYTRTERTTLTYAALLHDVGKLNLPRQLLDAKRLLTPGEATQIQAHVQHGVDLVSSLSYPQVIPAIAAHHERPDGLGYPQGLRGTSIPPTALVLAVADALDIFQMASPLLVPQQHQLVGKRLLQGAGTEWDTTTVHLALRLFGILPEPQDDHGGDTDPPLRMIGVDQHEDNSW